MTETGTVGPGKVVSIHYKLTLDDGQVVDSSDGQTPLSYLHGAGNIFPGLERALEGSKEGAELKVKVEPDDGYGQRDDGAIQEVPRAAFPDDAPPQVGLTVQATDEDGHPLIGTITAMAGDTLTVDFNHPLAGRNLNFEISVTGVRPATDEEQEHGHVHGPDGHEH